MKARTLTLSLQFTVSWPKAFCVPCKFICFGGDRGLIAPQRPGHKMIDALSNFVVWKFNYMCPKREMQFAFHCSCFSPTLGRLCFWPFVTCTRKEAAVQITFTFALSLWPYITSQCTIRRVSGKMRRRYPMQHFFFLLQPQCILAFWLKQRWVPQISYLLLFSLV